MTRASSAILVLAAAALAAVSCSAGPARMSVDERRAASAYGSFLAARYAGSARAADDAARLYADAMDAEPESAVISQNAFYAGLIAGDFDRAEAAAERALETEDADRRLPRLYLAADALARGRGDYEISEAGDGGPFSDTVRDILTDWLAVERGDGREVAERLDSFPLAGGAFATYWEIHKGLVFEVAGRHAEAEASLRRAHQVLDLKAFTALTLGAFLERRGERAEARAVYEAVLEGGGAPEVADALERLELRRRAPRRPDPARAAARAIFAPSAVFAARAPDDYAALYLRLVQRLDPEFDRNTYLLATVLERLRLVDAASGAFAAVEDGALVEPAMIDRAWLLFRNGDRQAAETLAADALERFGSDSARLLMADMSRVTGDCAQAAEIYAEVRERRLDAGLAPDWRHAFYEGVCRQISGDWAAAEALFLRALEIAPDEPRVLNHLGYNWIVLNRNIERGFEMVERAAQIEPENGAIIDSLGWGYFKLGRFDEAVRLLERATALSPYDPTINWHLGDAYARVGREREARFQWRRALELDPDAREERLIEARLDGGVDAGPADLE